AVPVGPALVRRLGCACPELAGHLCELSGAGSVEASLAYSPGPGRGLTYDATARLRRGSFRHPRLPQPLEAVEAHARCVDGRVPEARLPAASGSARVDLAVRDLTIPSDASTVTGLDDLARHMEVQVSHLTASKELIGRLPPELKWIETDYRPRGPVSVGYTF